MPDGGEECIPSAKSWVQVPKPVAKPRTARGLTPVPTLRYCGFKMFWQWPVLAIHARTTERGVAKPVAMFSPAARHT